MKSIVLLALVLILLSSMTTGMANEYVGVTEGEWFEYSLTYEGNFTEWEDKVVWQRITVQKINGTRVTIQEDFRYENNENRTAISEFDVITREGNFSVLTTECTLWFLVRTNLNVGDPIYIGGDEFLESCRINETLQQTYLHTIEVVHLNLSSTSPLLTVTHENGTVEEGPPYTVTINFYWKRETGVLQELVAVGNSTEDNLWGKNRILTINKGFEPIPEFPTWTPILVLMVTLATIAVITLTTIVVIFRKRLRKSNMW